VDPMVGLIWAFHVHADDEDVLHVQIDVRNSCTPSSLKYALIKTRLEVELLCNCSLTSKVVQGK
jgi:hypothetical protein